jgi:Concanavalin A-like lectin/glucanases superfamily
MAIGPCNLLSFLEYIICGFSMDSIQHRKLKAQGAIEFLSNYIWAIIVIAVVLAAFFFLGIFGGSSFQPRLQPGSCSVYRADGPGSVSEINVAGVCYGELPLSVADFKYGGAQPAITVNSIRFIKGQGLTLSGWVYFGGGGSSQVPFAYGASSAIYLSINSSSCGGGISLQPTSMCLTNSQTPLNKWIFVAVEYDNANGNIKGYAVINGNLINKTVPAGSYSVPAKSSLLIGDPWDGLISNVQLYNSSISSNTIMQLYERGIGGAPINLRNIVGWWQLNGNANDYSGDANNASSSSASYLYSYPAP